MTPDTRATFLAQTRLGFLSTLNADGTPATIPIWFEWDGTCARMFTLAASPKLARIHHDARATLLVASGLWEKEEWVSIEGAITIQDTGAIELAERLAARYWDLSDPTRAQTLQTWRDAADELLLLELHPSQIRSYH